MPLLSTPAFKDESAPDSIQADATTEASAAPVVEEEEEVQSKKGGKKAKGEGKKKGGGGGKNKKQEDVAPTADEGDGGETLVIDEIWPKKEALGLTKWSVRLTLSTQSISPCLRLR